MRPLALQRSFRCADRTLMLSWRTSALLAVLPIALVGALVLTQHGAPAAKPAPHLPSREEIAHAQAFFRRAEAVCYRSWNEMRRVRKAARPEDIRATFARVAGVDRTRLARLDALGAPPPRAAPRWHRALALLRVRHREFVRGLARFQPSAVAGMSRARFTRELRRFAAHMGKVNGELDKLAPSMGLWKCRK